jgi:hypothetical protein
MRRPAFAVLAAMLATAAPAVAADPARAGCTGSDVARDTLAHPETRRGAMDEQVCLGLDRATDGRRIELFGGTVDEGARERGLSDPGATRPREGLPGSSSDGYLGLRLRVPY